MQAAPVDRLPGFRRRFRITPGRGSVLTEVEDDFHCMGVRIRHDGRIATALDPVMVRAPWTTCPGAVEQLKQTFTGVALEAFVASSEKFINCTHLYDLALLGAAHAFDAEPLIYDIFVSDPVDGVRRAELLRNGATQLAWIEEGSRFVEPVELAGLSLDKMRDWINSLDAVRQEGARLLRWGSMLANGRTIPMAKQSDTRHLPVGGCYTFQPERMAEAKRIGTIRDFNDGKVQPLDEIKAVVI